MPDGCPPSAPPIAPNNQVHQSSWGSYRASSKIFCGTHIETVWSFRMSAPFNAFIHFQDIITKDWPEAKLGTGDTAVPKWMWFLSGSGVSVALVFVQTKPDWKVENYVCVWVKSGHSWACRGPHFSISKGNWFWGTLAPRAKGVLCPICSENAG